MGQMRRIATAKSFIEEKNFRNILNNGVAPVREFAGWSNKMQEIAAAKKPVVVMKVLRGIHTAYLEFEPAWKER